MQTLKISTPAKINITLEVIGKRGDGYHEVRSVMQAVRLCDELTFKTAPILTFSSNMSSWQPENSLVSRAARLLAAETGFTGGADIYLEKRIPLSSGMGGDSSCGAAALLGLHNLWQLNLPRDRMYELAASLGSDVPFFLDCGTALARGRGEQISALPSPGRLWLIIMVPPVAVPEKKTAALYGRLRPEDHSDGAHTGALIQLLLAGSPVADKHFFNVFESTAFNFFPGLYLYRQALLSAGAVRVHLAGSGPALFSLHRTKAEAELVFGKLSGWPVVLADTLFPGEPC